MSFLLEKKLYLEIGNLNYNFKNVLHHSMSISLVCNAREDTKKVPVLANFYYKYINLLTNNVQK